MDGEQRILRLENQVAALKNQLILANQKLMDAYIIINRVAPESFKHMDFISLEGNIKALQSLQTKY